MLWFTMNVDVLNAFMLFLIVDIHSSVSVFFTVAKTSDSYSMPQLKCKQNKSDNASIEYE